MPVRFENSYLVEGGNFNEAGKVSVKIKNALKELGISSNIQRRAAIAAYESEMNIIAHAIRGTLTVRVTVDAVRIDVKDAGPGIEDVGLAMKEGCSTAADQFREMGSGAGMGLSNIRDCSDTFEVVSGPHGGTHLKIVIHTNER